jgi:hypothetical protein
MIARAIGMAPLEGGWCAIGMAPLEGGWCAIGMAPLEGGWCAIGMAPLESDGAPSEWPFMKVMGSWWAGW